MALRSLPLIDDNLKLSPGAMKVSRFDLRQNKGDMQ